MSIRSRESQLATLRDNPNVDVLVVGGGINGIGTYRDLALQGVNVVLVERDDFCSGASTALSRMIHGGLRYMENGEFQLVKEALQERNLLLKNAPHYVAPLPTTIPIFDYFSGVQGAVSRFLGLSDKPSRRGALIIKTGLALYDLFTRKNRVMPQHSFRGKNATNKGWPEFPANVKCSATYYDAWITYPERLGLEMISDTAEATSGSASQALAFNYMNVDGSDGKKVFVTDSQTQERIAVNPKMIVNATGAWIDFTNGALSRSSDNQKTELVGGTKGSHLVVRNDRLLKATAGEMVYFENEEGRICILFPYFGNVLVGSTDLKLDDPEGNRCEEHERDYILDSLSYVFPDIKIDPSEVLYSFSGVRPLPKSSSAVTGQISRDHYCQIIDADEGFEIPVLCMIGGKWTTFRAFSEQASDRVMETLGQSRKTSTRAPALGGGSGFPVANGDFDSWITDLANRHDLPESRIRALTERYGAKADVIATWLGQEEDAALAALPSYSQREILYIIDQEQVVSVRDILFRRTAIAISGEISLALIDEVIALLAARQNWTALHSATERAEVLSRLSYFHGLSEDTLRQRNLN